MTEELFSWGRPQALIWLWGLAPLALFALWALRSRRRALDRLALAGVHVASRALGVARGRVGLSLVGLALCLLALAQPRYGYQWRELQQEGRALVVILDVSRSMDAQDVSPSRMERARRELIDLAERLRGDKIGLVLAAGGAYPRMPLTLDYDAFVQIVRDSDSGTLRAQGSDLGRAIEVAQKTLGPAGEADRAILIVSDGEDHVGKARAAAQAAADDGVRIYALGVGTTEGAPIPEPTLPGGRGGGFKKDAGGSVVLTRLDRDLLADLARIGGGGYADSVAGTSDTQALYTDGILGALQAAVQGTRREKVWTERYQWPLGLGLLLLAIAAGLRPPRARRAAPVAAVALLLLLPLSGRAADPPATPQARVDALLAEQADHPGDLDIAERLGEALFRAGDYNRALDVLTAVAEQSDDPAQQARARYNAGHAAYQGGRLIEAADAWNQAAQLDPEDQDAAANAQAVQEEIARRLQQQPPEQDPSGEQQDGEQQDGEQQDGEQQDGEQQDGQQQDGQQQDGEQQDGEQQDGQQQDGQQQDGEQQDGQQQDGQQQPPESDGSREAQPGEDDPAQGEPGQAEPPTAAQAGEGQDSGAAQQGEIQAAGEQGDTGGEPGDAAEASRPGSVSEQEADRMFDSAEEGSPRVVLDPASQGGKDW
ncbi:MAG: VWA domain-containing protein [Alphaproteobacteria bacterium]|nr:VWA domain-containing protein [Alphaproteobacteria bacterium]